VTDSLRRASYRFQHNGCPFLRYSLPLTDASGNKSLRERSLIHRPFYCCFNNLSGGLLGLLVERQGKDVENLLVLDLLVRLDLLEVKRRGATEHAEAVLGNGNGGEQSADGLGIRRANDLVLTDDTTTDATTPTLPARSSSSWRKLKGKVPNFFLISPRVARELGRLRPYVVSVLL
jgi:hypothetical protein